MFPALRDLSFLFNLWNLLHRNHCRALFIPLVSEFRLESFLFLSKRVLLGLKNYLNVSLADMVEYAQTVICIWEESLIW